MNENKILEIKFLLIPFSVFVFVLIVFENLFAFILIFILFLLAYIYLSYKYKNISFVSLLFFTASLTFVSYLFFMFNLYQKYDGYEKIFFTKTFIIDEILVNNRYVGQDEFGNNFILKNLAKNYKLGEKIKVYGMFYPIQLSNKNFYGFLQNKFLSFRINIDNFLNIGKFDYTKYLAMKHIVGTVFSKKEYSIGQEKLSLTRQIRQDMVKKIDYIYSGYDNKYKALTLGLLIGDKSYLSKILYDKFIHSGLVHIIVVSGGNIMFVIIFLSIILFFIPFYARLFVIAGGIIFYSFMVGMDSSVVRATIMGLLSLIALFFGKVTDVRRILALAFIFMLVYNPYFLLYDLGFILSFLAIVGILLFNKFSLELDKENKIKYALGYFHNNYVLPTLGASLFTAPAILFWTKQVNIFAFVASIFVVPIVPLLMLNSFLLLFLPSFLLDFFLHINIYLMDYIFFFVDIFSDKFALFIHI